MVSRLHQHMLMAQITESFDNFLARVVRKIIPRLLVINGELPAEDDEDDLQAEDDEGGQPAEDNIAYLLAELRMAVRLRTAVDDHIRFMVAALGRVPWIMERGRAARC
jgi:hypothetical protein